MLKKSSNWVLVAAFYDLWRSAHLFKSLQRYEAFYAEGCDLRLVQAA
jgi:hypothetical protein